MNIDKNTLVWVLWMLHCSIKSAQTSSLKHLHTFWTSFKWAARKCWALNGISFGVHMICCKLHMPSQIMDVIKRVLQMIGEKWDKIISALSTTNMITQIKHIHRISCHSCFLIVFEAFFRFFFAQNKRGPLLIRLICVINQCHSIMYFIQFFFSTEIFVTAFVVIFSYSFIWNAFLKNKSKTQFWLSKKTSYSLVIWRWVNSIFKIQFTSEC